MKVALLSRYFDYRNSGIGRVSSELFMGLIRRGHAVTAVSDSSDTIPAYFAYDALGILNKIPSGCDVYHALTPGESIWLDKKKSVVTIYDLILTAHPERAGAGASKSKFNLWAGKAGFGLVCKTAKECARIITISEETKADIMYFLKVPEYKIKLIRLGIRDDLNPATKKDNVFRIGYLGQLDRRKRVDVLIQSFMRSPIDGELVIAGKGVDEKQLKLMAQFDSRVKFAGFVPDDKIAEWYQSLDYFIFPTFVEGYGLPIPEAMACKIPVVVLADALIPVELKKRCIIVDTLDEFFNGYIFDMASDSYGAKWLEDNYQFAKLHSWDKYVSETIKVYEEVCY